MSPSKLKLTLRNPLNTIKYKTAVTESVQGPSVLVVLLLFVPMVTHEDVTQYNLQRLDLHLKIKCF